MISCPPQAHLSPLLPTDGAWLFPQPRPCFQRPHSVLPFFPSHRSCHSNAFAAQPASPWLLATPGTEPVFCVRRRTLVCPGLSGTGQLSLGPGTLARRRRTRAEPLPFSCQPAVLTGPSVFPSPPPRSEELVSLALQLCKKLEDTTLPGSEQTATSRRHRASHSLHFCPLVSAARPSLPEPPALALSTPFSARAGLSACNAAPRRSPTAWCLVQGSQQPHVFGAVTCCLLPRSAPSLCAAPASTRMGRKTRSSLS